MIGLPPPLSGPPPLYNNLRGTNGPCSSAETGAPPSYEEAINPNGRVYFRSLFGLLSDFILAPPPSYDSLFGRVREAQKTSKGVLDFIKNILIILLGTCKNITYLVCKTLFLI